MFRKTTRMLLLATVAAVAAWIATPTLAARWGVAVFPSGAEFSLEVVESDAERARGYMFREKVGPSEGMLFVFTESGRHSFWMRNCRVSLDLIWLDADFRVVHIEPDQAPCPDDGECPSIVPFQPGSYVLEVAAGISAKHSLQLGDQLVIHAEPALR